MHNSRREFVKQGAALGVGLLTVVVAGCEKKVTPAQARQMDLPYRTLGKAHVQTLEAIGEVLLPGSTAAGLSHYIDHQLSGPPSDNMLMIKYLGVPAPFANFYKGGLSGAIAAAQQQFAKTVWTLTPAELQTLVAGMAKGESAGWTGPPAGFFFFVLRNDAVDATYGTQAGFEALGVPYMAHIVPATRWGA